jgi:hypothetical protein
MMPRRFPQYVKAGPEVNLREVAPNLFVGGWRSPKYGPLGRGKGEWAAIVNLSEVQVCFAPLGDGHVSVPATVNTVYLGWYFADGERFPPGLLDAVESVVRHNLRRGPVLIHCAAGKSRAPSTAYAMLRTIWHLPHEDALRVVRSEDDPGGRYPVPATLASARAWVRAR